MRNIWILTGLAALTLSACATPVPPVSVTRFHRIDATTPMPQGSYAIDSQSAQSGIGIDASYAAAVRDEMNRLGYTPVAADAQPTYIVSLHVTRDVQFTDRSGSGVGVGVGGGVGGGRGYHSSGVGVGVSLDLGRLFGSSNRGDVALTQMAVRITRHNGDLALWEGRAETAARVNSPAAQPGLNAGKLASALFANFPGNSGETVTVP